MSLSLPSQFDYVFSIMGRLSEPETSDGYIGLTGCAGIPPVSKAPEGPPENLTFDVKNGIAYNSDGTVHGFIGVTGNSGVTQ